MAFNSEVQKKLQIFLAVAIVVVGARAAYIVYERREAIKEEAKPKHETALKADFYVSPKKLRPYDLKSARELTKQPVWVRVGGQITCYPYDRARHRTDWAHELGTLGSLQKLDIMDVVTDVPPKADGTKQVMALFEFDDKSHWEGNLYAAPIGVEKDSEFRIYSDDAFFIEDPHELYKHWPAEVWQKIDAHEVQAGMSELQCSFAIGLGVPEGSGPYGSRTLHYPNGGKPLVIVFDNDKAVSITPGA